MGTSDCTQDPLSPYWLLFLTCMCCHLCAKFGDNRSRNATVGVHAERQTHEHFFQAHGVVLLPMLSSRRDDPYYEQFFSGVISDFYIDRHFKRRLVVKLLNQRWWIPVFRRNCNMTGDMYMCVSVTGNILRVHTHNTSFFKVPYHKSVKQKIDLVPWDACNG